MRLKSSGFTLIEILIATLIFTWIATETARAIRNTNQNKSRVDEEVDTYQAIRAAFGVISRDLHSIYHLNVIDFLPFGHLLPEDRPDTLKDPAAYQNFIEERFPGLKHKSHFVGTQTELHFSSLSNIRLYADRPESDQVEVSYTIREDTNEAGVIHLYKRSSPLIDENYGEGGPEYLLLEDLSSIRWRYYDADSQTWQEQWDSSEESTFDEIPSLIELTLVVNMRHPQRDDGVKKLELLTSFRPLFSNSYKKIGLGGMDSLEKAMQAPSSATGQTPDQGGGATSPTPPGGP